MYMLDDLLDGKLPPYKLYVFLNAFHLDNARRDHLRHGVERNTVECDGIGAGNIRLLTCCRNSAGSRFANTHSNLYAQVDFSQGYHGCDANQGIKVIAKNAKAVP